jgi:chromatin segregation and condensation protein Rec8/ScpA/Scc1 (kleisin family)
MDEFLAHIEENIEEFYGKIINQSIHGVPLSFRKLVKGQSLIEMVRVFIMLLFLANQKKILLEQDESLDILIRLGQVSPPIV